MTSKERILNALRGGNVDYVPMIIGWNEEQKLHDRLSWSNSRERLEYAARMGWDTCLRISATVTPTADVKITRRIREQDGLRFISQTWETPAATLSEEVRLTDDWDRGELAGPYLGLASDFRTPRYVEYPFKTAQDIEALAHIFPEDNPRDMEQIKENYRTQRALADEFGYPLFAYMDSGMDWLVWLYPLAEAICRAVDEPENVRRILDYINASKHKRLELLLSLGIDGIVRRGWYECTDMWSPALLEKFAWPALRYEIDMTHKAGKVFIYTIDTGVKGIAADLAAMDMDCLLGIDPAQGDMSVREAHDAFPGKTLWGGFSGPKDFGADTPDRAAKAVEEAITVYGGKRLILGMAASYRYYYPWENYEAAERAWKKFR